MRQKKSKTIFYVAAVLIIAALGYVLTKEVSVNVGNFGSVTYNQTSRAALESYISSLKSQIAAAEGKTTSSRRRMIKVVF